MTRACWTRRQARRAPGSGASERAAGRRVGVGARRRHRRRRWRRRRLVSVNARAGANPCVAANPQGFWGPLMEEFYWTKKWEKKNADFHK